jgi:hypothetical protein
MRRSAAPIIAAVLLLLPVLYVGSYLALVTPQLRTMTVVHQTPYGQMDELRYTHYRIGEKTPELVFWPLEQIDRRVRPAAWDWDLWDPRRQKSIEPD